MRTRDGFAKLNGDETEHVFESGTIDIIADDGRTMFSLTLKGKILHVDGGNVVKHGGELLDDRFIIIPKASNCVEIEKKIYES